MPNSSTSTVIIDFSTTNLFSCIKLSPIVLNIEIFLQSLVHMVNLGHVTAHADITGNELVDKLVKEVTSNPEIEVPIPY